MARREGEEIGVVASTVLTSAVGTLVNLGYTLGVSCKKTIAIAAGARLVPRNTPIAIAPIAIRLICLIIVSYCILLNKKPNVASHL
ncbi:MAG: hypothetical protein WBF33_22030 [Candidatus Nitrosopolaris sp.]